VHDVTAHDVEVDEQAGYWPLVTGNRNVRRLWLGTVISLLGDWFNTIALYVLVTELTGSPLALGAVFITKMLPWALSAPLAGVLVDRYDRRRLMIGTDLLRAVVVLSAHRSAGGRALALRAPDGPGGGGSGLQPGRKRGPSQHHDAR
jgi:MFS family permease